MTGTFVLKNPQVVENCIRAIRELPEGKPYMVTIGKPNKSRAQESYFHACLKVIADYTGDTLEDVKMRIKYSVLPLREVTVNGKTYLYPESTVDQPKEVYSKLIDAVLMAGAMLELKMPDPQFYGVS